MYGYIGPWSAERIVVVLEKSSIMSNLNLAWGGVCDQGAERIAVALEKNITVTILTFFTAPSAPTARSGSRWHWR